MEPWPAVVVIVSDRASRGERPDATAGPLAEVLAAAGFAAGAPIIVPDDRAHIAATLRAAAERAVLVVTTGGTGIAPRDVTPEATLDVLDRVIPGIGEAMRAASRAVTPLGDLSRATAGVRGRSLVVNLPGSPRGAMQCLEAIRPLLAHAVRLVTGAVADCADDRKRAAPEPE